MTIFFTSSDQQKIEALEKKISDNCGIPNTVGTLRWAKIEKAFDQDLWFIPKPDAAGWTSANFESFSQEEMLAGVDLAGITEQEFNPNWIQITNNQ